MREETTVNENGKWACSNVYFEAAVLSGYDLSGVSLAILSLITKEYERIKRMGKEDDCTVYYSYDDLERMLLRCRATIVNAVNRLLSKKLIERVNCTERIGRAKSGYKPNFDTLNDILNKYFEDIPESEN